MSRESIIDFIREAALIESIIYFEVELASLDDYDPVAASAAAMGLSCELRSGTLCARICKPLRGRAVTLGLRALAI